MRVARSLGSLLHRLQPRTLRGRLSLAVMALSLVLVVASFAITYRVGQLRLDSITNDTVAQQLDHFRAFTDSELDELDGFAIDGGSSRELATPEGSVADTTAAIPYAKALRRRARANVLVWLDRTGEVLYAAGPREDIAEVKALVGHAKGGRLNTLAWLPGGLHAVVSRGVVGPAGPPSLLVLTRAVDPSSDRLVLAPGVARVELLAPATPTPASRARLIVAGFGNVSVGTASGTSVATADLAGRSAAGRVRVVLDDSQLQNYLSAAGFTALGASLLAGLLGAGFGIALSRVVRTPLERTVAHLREQGERALEGEKYRPLELEPFILTSEFEELQSVYDEMMAALTAKQADLREATEAAQQAQETLHVAIVESPEAKILLQEDAVVLVNPAATALFGLPAENILGRTTRDLFTSGEFFDADGDPLGYDEFGDAMRGPLVVRFVRVGQPDRWLEIQSIVHDSDPRRILVSTRDITEERRLEAVREEIFSLISHDLRAPLTVIQGYLDILERPLEPEARQRALASARLNAQKMAGLLEDLLDATRAEQLLAPKTMQRVDLGTLASEVRDSLGQTEQLHELRLCCDGPAHVIGEERRLRQALVNVVTNAFKYTPRGTAVTISVTSGAGKVLLVVEDEGPGIPVGERERVFERYRRLDDVDGRKPGLGLGLYIVRVIAENHGGAARVEEAPGGGARFVVELPEAPAEKPVA